MTKIEFKERTIKAKRILETAIGREVTGYRAPNAYIAGWMIDILEEIGFKYDSSVSVNSIYNKSDCQFKNVNTRPYYPSQGTLDLGNIKRNIIEIPWPYFQFIVKFPTGGGPILRLLGARYIMRGLKESMQRGDTLFYFHPIDISDENFPLNISLIQRLFWMIKGDRITRRIKTILEAINSHIITCSELVQEND